MSVLLVLALIPTGPVYAQDDEADAFRPACDLVDVAGASAIVGAELTAIALGGQSCLWSSGATSVTVVLADDGGIDTQRAVFPGADEVTVAGHPGITVTLQEPAFTTLIVGLDDGGTMQIQVVPDGGLPPDPEAAAIALAEAMFASGPVLARPADSGPSGPALGYDGNVCDLVTVAEMQDASGKRKIAEAAADTPETCTYMSKDFSLVISVGFIDGELLMFQGGDAEELEVAGRPAVWSTQFFDTLVADIGGGRLLQVGLISMDGRPRQLRGAAEAIAAVAVGRLVPVEGVAPTTPDVGDPTTSGTAGPGCDVLPVETVASITGLPFAVASDEGIEGTGCSYTAADPSQPYYLVLSRLELADPSAAVSAMSQGMPGLSEPEGVDVAGLPGLVLTSEFGTLVGVDLDGIAGQEGQVLAIMWLTPPPGVDTTSTLTELAGAAIAALGG